MHRKPEFVRGQILRRVCDGVTDDLLTGGLGKAGMERTVLHPEEINADTLRQLAIFANYKGLLDFRPEGGFGLLYGPDVAPDGIATRQEGMVAGKEYLAYADDGSGEKNVVMMVQIPDSFDPEKPCVVAAPSSGSRGIYGAVGLVGEWALKRGFAVAYTDKGTGMGGHDLDTDTVNLITGERTDREKAGTRSHFTAKVGSDRKIGPHRIAVKHAHSGQNPEADWGQHVLQSIEFAFYLLNLEENFGAEKENGEVAPALTCENTIVIASGISNGGGASLRAAEQDQKGLIDGVAVSEPNVCPEPSESIVVRQGQKEWKGLQCGKNLLDYMTLLNIYQPCANLAPGLRGVAPMNHLDETLCETRCRELEKRGLLAGDSIEQMAFNAQEIINDYGILEEQNYIQPSHFANFVVEGICVAYANAYGKFGPEDNLCGFSYASVDRETKTPAPWKQLLAERSFGDGNGIVPTSGVELINDRSAGGPVLNRESVSSTGQKDMNLEGALCLRSLATGRDETGAPLNGERKEHAERIAEGTSQVRACGNLKGTPAIIVHGRNDAILPPNHTSRAYAALNSIKENDAGNLRYCEVTNAHHLDVFNAFPGFDARFVPLQCYLLRALDWMYDHLAGKKPLPPSQVVRTVPRGSDENGHALPITPDNVPPIQDNPPEKDRISILRGTVAVPD